MHTRRFSRCVFSPPVALACGQDLSTDHRSAGCSIEQSVAQVCQDTSAATTIRCSDSIGGKRIFDPRSEATTDAHSARQRSCRSILEVAEVKTVPYLPISHPFVERLIGTIRREYLDVVPFWTARDLEKRLLICRDFYNDQRCHYALDGGTPGETDGNTRPQVANLEHYRWRSHCRGLFQLPVAA